MSGDRDRDVSGDAPSMFEFLEDDDADAAGPGEVVLVPLPPLLPVAPSNAWAAMDADYRAIPAPPPLPWPALCGGGSSRDVLRQRARLEMPVLVAWLLLTAGFPSPPALAVLGVSLIAFSVVMRRPFALAHLAGQAGVYRALGGGQLAVAFVSIVHATAWLPLLALYGVGVLFAWVCVECRNLYRLEQRQGEGHVLSPF